MNKKILLVIDSLGSGGGQKLCLNLANGLIKKSYQVEVFVYNTSNDEFNFFNSEFKKAKIKLITVKSSKFNNKIFSKINVLIELRKLFKSEYYSVVSFLHIPSIYSAFAKLGTKSFNLTICELSSSKAPVKFLTKILFYIACIISNNVVANSISESKSLSKKLFLSKKVCPIWNGFDTSNANFLEENINKNITNNLIIIARVAYPKNGLNLLKGLLLFLKENGWAPKISWVGRNEIDKRSVKMQKQMKDFIEDNNEIKHYFEFYGEVKNVNKLYKTYDALILPSIYEGLPLVICEAMLASCFILASNVCDHPYIIGEDRGILFDPNSPKSIANAINDFYSLSPEKNKEIRQNAKHFALNNFALDNMVDSFEKLF